MSETLSITLLQKNSRQP